MFSFILPICSGCVASFFAVESLLDTFQADYVCDNPAFTLKHNQTDEFILNGIMDVPHPGYKYTSSNDDPHGITLKMYSDEGFFPMVISQIKIHETIISPGEEFIVSINKPFKWGLKSVTCIVKE